MNRRILSALLVTGLVTAACSDTEEPLTAPDSQAPIAEARAEAPGQQDTPVVPGRVLVRFAPGADAPGIANAAGAAIDRPMALGIQMLRVPEGAESRVANALANNPNVEFAEPDYIYLLGDPAVMPVNDAFIGYKWDLDNDGSIYSSVGDVLATTGGADHDMDWREAVQAAGTLTGSARIGIMDSGIRNDHEEFVGRIAAQYDFFANDTNAEDDNGHGTHVAGIAAADTDNGVGVAGVAYSGNVTFAIAKVCGQQRGGGPFGGYGCPNSAITNGITWAVDNGANVLNLSLGGGASSSATQSALAYARANGVLPFCASGNENSAVSFPAAYPECVAVGSTDWNDERASYSNFGPQVELSAPGGDDEDPNGYSYILSSYNGSSTSYAFLAGTSMASPQAAGLAALLHVLGVTDDDQKLAIMKSTSDDLGAPGTDDLFGAGRINVAAAVAAAGGGNPGGGNTPPNAAFASDCTNLACDFADSSSDPDGSIVSWSWSFGDGNGSSTQNPSHTYAAAGTYTVTLTVTDNEGATDAASSTVTVADAPPPPTGISLSANGYKVKGAHTIDLSWSGATSSNVDVYRNGALLATTANDGAYTDATNNKGGGSYTYQVCEAGTSTCSGTVNVVF